VHKDTDAEADGEVVGVHQDGQVKVEGMRMQGNAPVKRAREHVTAHMQSTTVVEEDDQHTSTDGNDIPEDPTEPPPPFSMPDKLVRPQKGTLSVELKGKR
jgi:hypothetical protein